METQLTDQNKTQASRAFSNRLLILTIAGSASFWITDFIMSVSPIAAEYKAAFSISSLAVALVEAFAGSMVIALCVSFFLLRFFDRIPGKRPIFKALFLTFFMMLMIESFVTLGNPADAYVYLVLDTAMNIPRFLALGLVTGYFLDKQNRKFRK